MNERCSNGDFTLLFIPKWQFVRCNAIMLNYLAPKLFRFQVCLDITFWNQIYWKNKFYTTEINGQNGFFVAGLFRNYLEPVSGLFRKVVYPEKLRTNKNLFNFLIYLFFIDNKTWTFFSFFPHFKNRPLRKFNK